MWLCCLFYAHFCQASIFTMCAWWKLTSKYSLVDEIWITVSKYSRYPKVCCSVILLQRQSFGQHPHLLDIYIPWVTFGLFFWRFSICTFFFAFFRKKGTKDAKKVHKLNWMGIPCSQTIPRVDSAQFFPCQLVPVDDVQISADCALHCTIKLRINFGELSCLDVNYKSSDIYLWNPWSSLSSDILVIVYSGANMSQHLTGV